MAKEIATRPSERPDADGFTEHQKLDLILNRLAALDLEVFKLRNDLAMTFGDEFNPKRQEMSQELASRMRKKLAGEEKARLMYGPGEMKYTKEDSNES